MLNICQIIVIISFQVFCWV